MSPLQLGFALFTAFIPVFILTPVAIRLFNKWHILDKPDERKTHTGNIPVAGGVVIFLGYVFACLLWIPFEYFSLFRVIFLAQIIVIFLGIRDDWKGLGPIGKIFWQVLASGIIIYSLGLKFNYAEFLVNAPEYALPFNYFITLAFFIFLTNSFNLIDGIDGLAGSIALIIYTTLGIWFWMANEVVFATIAFALLGGVLGFLYYNWSPARVFMGDTGSLFLGLSICLLTLKAFDLNAGLPHTNKIIFHNPITTLLCITVIPITDSLRVIILRLFNKQSPLRADRRHLHHTLLDLGLNHPQSTLILSGVNFSFIIIAVLTKRLSDYYSIPLILVIAISLISLLEWRKRLSKKKAEAPIS